MRLWPLRSMRVRRAAALAFHRETLAPMLFVHLLLIYRT
jgi:hypothetical protein